MEIETDTQIGETLRSFYSEEVVGSILLPLIDRTGGVSLRLIDWLVTNYAKAHDCHATDEGGSAVAIHSAYKLALSVYSRTDFDPFRRGARVPVTVRGRTAETTRGQAHFVMWAHKRGVLSFARRNRDKIDADMNECALLHKEEIRSLRKKGVKVVRKPLSSVSGRKCAVYAVSTRVNFDLL